MTDLDQQAYRYIAARRGSEALNRTSPGLRTFYERQWRSLLSAAEQFVNHRIQIDLHVVYSPEARAETVTTENGAFVIYDQYLGQIVSQLTRLVRNDGPHGAMKNYIRKLYALRLSVAGRQAEGFLQSRIYKSTFVPFQPNPADARRAVDVIVQEAFILGHELTHQMCRSEPVIAAVITGLCRELTTVGAKVSDEERASMDASSAARAAADRLLFDLDTQFIRDGGSADDIDHSSRPSRQFWQDSYELYLQNPRPTYTKLLEEVASDARIFEEFCCDSFGVLLLMMQPKMFGLEQEDVLAAAFLGLHNVRLLRYIDTLAVNGPNSPLASHTFIRETQSRVSLFRIFTETASQLLSSSPATNAGGLKKLRDLYRNTNQTYAAVINDHVLYNAEKDLWNLPGKEELSELDESELRAAILESCGLI